MGMIFAQSFSMSMQKLIANDSDIVQPTQVLRAVKKVGIVVIIIVLTLLTQVGGLIYLLTSTAYKPIEKRINNKWFCALIKTIIFVFTYSAASFVVVPILAKPFGRVALSFTKVNNLRPGTPWTCILNRNYVKPELRDLAYSVASQMAVKYPGTTINFLDANFPFLDKFPMLPHWSHNDGKKLDLSFCYNDSSTGQQTNAIPSPIGYGICEVPREGEINQPCECGQRGYWQYSLLQKIVPQRNEVSFIFNEQKTKDLVELFAGESAIGKIFIEPHLVKRLHLNSKKIKYHGCHAVRHDDHIHVQLK